MERKPPYNHHVDVAGEIVKVTPTEDGGKIFTLHNFNKTIKVLFPAEALGRLDFDPVLGLHIRALSSRDRISGMWVAKRARIS